MVPRLKVFLIDAEEILSFKVSKSSDTETWVNEPVVAVNEPIPVQLPPVNVAVPSYKVVPLIVPLTSSKYAGDLVPIPTLLLVVSTLNIGPKSSPDIKEADPT